jgi:ABC-2 type transport system permease protein
MSKIWTIIQREYWTRVRTKAFILGTLLMPLGMVVMLTIPIIASLTVEQASVKVLVNDVDGTLMPLIESDENFVFVPESRDWEAVKPTLAEGEVYVLIPSHAADAGPVSLALQVKDRLSIQLKDGIDDRLTKAMHRHRMSLAGITEQQVKATEVQLFLSEENTEGEKNSAEVGMVAGYLMSMLIYILMIMYGMFVMRGVIEEKTSRILEVMISSVKPFQLMMGKLLGICLVGLTQFVLWMVISGVLMTVVSAVAGGMMASEGVPATPGMGSMPAPGMGQAGLAENIGLVMQVFSIQNLLLFLFYFLGGFFLYGSLFAAVGSAVDQEADAQQLTWPVMVPLVLPIMIISNVLQNPNGKLAVFLSIFPFSSPTIMMVRITSTDVPWYEVAASMVLLVLGIFGTVWMAARIYRVGVLMYGKKVTLREIARWMWRS